MNQQVVFCSINKKKNNKKKSARTMIKDMSMIMSPAVSRRTSTGDGSSSTSSSTSTTTTTIDMSGYHCANKKHQHKPPMDTKNKKRHQPTLMTFMTLTKCKNDHDDNSDVPTEEEAAVSFFLLDRQQQVLTNEEERSFSFFEVSDDDSSWGSHTTTTDEESPDDDKDAPRNTPHHHKTRMAVLKKSEVFTPCRKPRGISSQNMKKTTTEEDLYQRELLKDDLGLLYREMAKDRVLGRPLLTRNV